MNLFDLSGKVAIVTGGNGGIGLGIARGLAGAGARLAIVGRNEVKTRDAAGALAAETGVEVVPLPATSAARTRSRRWSARVLARFGRVDILVNNAGRHRPQAAARPGPRRVEPGPRHQPDRPVPALQGGLPRAGGGGRAARSSTSPASTRSSVRPMPRPTRRARGAWSSSPRASRWRGPGSTSRSTRSCPAGSIPS